MSWIDKALGVYPQALVFHSQRSAVLAANIANTDTPGYLARDYDFKTALKQQMHGQKLVMRRTNDRHISTSGDSRFGTLQYRVPTKLEVENGNTVEEEVEQAAFTSNAVRYQASLQFLSGAVAGLKLAIKGE